MTPVRPRFSRRFISGFVAAMTEEACVSFSDTSALMPPKRRFSYSVRESALMTRMPVTLSRTMRTMRSPASRSSP